MKLPKIKKIKKKWLILIVVVILILAVGLTMFFRNPMRGGMQMTTNVRSAQTMTIEKTIESEGQIQSSLEENIVPHTSYYLKEIKVSEGDALSEGDTILTYSNGKELTAPYDCVVESWSLPESGDQLTNDHYVTIAGTDVLMMELSVDETSIANIEKGQSATVTVEATNGRYEGEVTYVSEVGSYSSGTSTFKAKVEFDNDGEIKLGMTGKAVVTLGKAENVIAVPTSAVHSGMDGSYVSVAQNGDSSNTTEVKVETGLSNDSYIEIKSGLAEGDQVVVPETDSDSGSGFPGGFSGGGSMPSMPGGSGGGSMPSMPSMPGGSGGGSFPS